MASKSQVVAARLRRAPPILVCRKCLSRTAEGKALRQALKADAKRRSAGLGVKRPRVILTGCFGICPKRAVVAASVATLQKGEALLLSDVAQSTEAVARLMENE